jgi:hypothetical protein
MLVMHNHWQHVMKQGMMSHAAMILMFVWGL